MKWIFVYAAQSGRIHAALDWAHKIVSPSTYACSLCAVTYGVLGQRQEWTEALDRLPGTKEFYHRDEFAAQFPERECLAPAVWTVEGERWTVVLGTGDWDDIGSVADLEARLHPPLLRSAQ